MPDRSTAATTTARAATTRFRLHHRQARAVPVIARAVIGSPPSHRLRSSARSFAVVYRFPGSFSKHFRQIVSRSRGTLAVESPRTRRLVVDHLMDQHPGIAAKRQFAGEQFKQDHPQRIHVAARIRIVGRALGLLGRHVGGRAQDLAVHRHRDLAGLALGQAEVHDVRLASRHRA